MSDDYYSSPPERSRRRGLHMQSGEEFLSTRPRQREWLVEGLLQHPSMTLLVGDGGTRKSLFAQSLTIALVTGRPLFDAAPIPQPRVVAYLQVESAEDAFRHRFRLVMNGMHLRVEDLNGRLHVLTNQAFQLDNKDHMEWLIGVIGERGIEVLVVDPLRDMHSQDENSSEAMKPVADALRRLRDECGVSVVLLHHTNKNPEHKTPSAMSRGTTALWNWMDGRWSVKLRGEWSRVGGKHGLYLKEGGQGRSFEFRPLFQQDRVTFDFRWVDGSAAPTQLDARRSEHSFLDTVRRLGRPGIKELVDATPFSDSATQRLARRLCKAGKLKREKEKVGKTSRFVYFLPTAGEQQRAA